MVWVVALEPSPLVLIFVLLNMSRVFVLHRNWGNSVVQNQVRVESCHKLSLTEC